MPVEADLPCRCDPPRHPHLRPADPAEVRILVDSLHDGCPQAAWVLCLELARRVNELMGGISSGLAMTSDSEGVASAEVLGTCWLTLHGWPRSEGDVLTRMAHKIVSTAKPGPPPESPLDPREFDRLAAPETGAARRLLDRARKGGFLRPDQHKLLIERHIIGLTSEEIAGRRQVPAARIRRQCQRARQRLRVSQADLPRLSHSPATPTQTIRTLLSEQFHEEFLRI